MKRLAIASTAAATLVVLGGAGLTALFATAHADATGAAQAATITVVGHSDQQVAPDVAVIDAGVMTKANDAESAQQQNDAAMNKLMSALQNAGVKSGDIHTQWYNIHPDYSQPDTSGQSTVAGFEADDNIELVLHNLDDVGNVVDLLVKSGANQINNVSYQVSNPRQTQQQLYDAALADAKAQAQRIASSLGVSITGVQSVDTTQGSVAIPYATAAASDTAAPLSPGTQDIASNVRVVYTISGSGN